jgi:epidermal growth factor receptor substrate 15
VPAPSSSTSSSQPPPPVGQTATGGRVPPLLPEKAVQYAKLFEQSDPQNGLLSGDAAKRIFEGAKLPNEVLGKIWSLSDTEQRGALNATEFVIAMHLLVSYKNDKVPSLPAALPRGLYEAAARLSNPAAAGPAYAPNPAAIGSGYAQASPQRFQSGPGSIASQGTGDNAWGIAPADKARFDTVFADLDKQKRGFISGEEAVPFFSRSNLSEDMLAQIWDLADINSEGHLDRDEFAVALHLIQLVRNKPGYTLPDKLPLNLIPPRLRQSRPLQAPPVQPQPVQQQPPPQEQPFPPTSKSAMDDLLGLEPMAATAVFQTPASTGRSGAVAQSFDNDSGPKRSATESSLQQSPSSTMFRPFKPSSNFGQSLLAATNTGGSSGSGRKGPSAMDDPLDPEVSNKLNSEHTTELANLSNQAGNLSKQVTEVKNKRTSTEGELAAANAQKQQFEARLNQMRTLYEQEAKDVQLLQERLTASRKDTAQLQQQCATIEQNYQEIQNEHRQVVEALEADQTENRGLKEKIRIVNAAIAQLRPELDKLRSEARQQKGLNAITKKQLSTAESERDKLQEEGDQLKRAESTETKTSPPPVAITSPALSQTSQSTNPFHRKSPQASVDNTMTPSQLSNKAAGANTFDSMFGPAVTSPQPVSTSRSEPESSAAGSQKPTNNSTGYDFSSPAGSPRPQDSPHVADPPPPPAPDRQINSSFLPFRNPNERADSFSSSLNVVPSTNVSKFGADTSRADTPTNWVRSAQDTPTIEKEPSIASTADTKPLDRVETLKSEVSRQSSSQSISRTTSIPGAFPESHSPILATPTGGSALSEASKTSTRAGEASFPPPRADPFGLAKETAKGPTASKDDFDAAFASLSQSKTSEKSAGLSESSGNLNRFHQEFPPIEVVDSEESESSSEHGFDDNFTTTSPARTKGSLSQNQSPTATRPVINGKDSQADGIPTVSTPLGGGPPAASAQKSPPAYENPAKLNSEGVKDPNQFPPEFSGLLPSRADPTHSTTEKNPPPSQSFFAPQPPPASSSRGAPSTAHTFSSSPPLSSNTPLSNAPSDANPPALAFGSGKGLSSQNNLVAPPKSSLFDDDFDKEFSDLAAAKEADKGDEFDFGSPREAHDDFNPTFDSPSISKTSTLASATTATGKSGPHEDAFSDFDHHLGGPAHAATGSTSSATKKPSLPPVSNDWDSLFADFPTPSDGTSVPKPNGKEIASAVAPAADASNKLSKPTITRTTTTEHDDPILKSLTSMGYSRSDALDALEKYDYNIDKV